MIAHQNVGELEWDLMERVFALNTFSAMKLTSLCVPLLRKSENDPNVVNLSSIVVRHGGRPRPSTARPRARWIPLRAARRKTLRRISA